MDIVADIAKVKNRDFLLVFLIMDIGKKIVF